MAELQAVLAEFETPQALMEAARTMRAQGWAGLDAYTPFPVEGLADILGVRDRRVPVAALAGGLAGAVIGFGMQVAATLAYALPVGGRPLIATPAFVMITFELMVLGAVLCGLAAMVLSNRLPRLNHPVFDVARLDLSRDDRFFLEIRAGRDFDRDAVGRALTALSPRAIIDIPARIRP